MDGVFVLQVNGGMITSCADSSARFKKLIFWGQSPVPGFGTAAPRIGRAKCAHVEE